MSAPRSQGGGALDASGLPFSPSRESSSYDGAVPAAGPNPTYAIFSPATLSSTSPTATSAAKRRSTILVHQKSPLLLATPPQITRALAYSHPFLLPLNKLVGLLSWTTSDPWESFLLVVAFWATVLYGDAAIRYAGPVVLVLLLILGMYGRRFSPLSSSGWSEPGLDGAATSAASTKPAKGKAKSSKNLTVEAGGSGPASAAPPTAGGGGGGHQRTASEITSTRHQKTLDEIVETLKEFTSRCNILLEPLLELTDFLSTQRTPTSATTRPALTTLFIRIILCTPFWFALTLPPFRIISTRRVLLVFGTVILTWHARVMKAARVILWRSASLRRLTSLVTGLDIEIPSKDTPLAGLKAEASASTVTVASKDSSKTASTVKSSQESELTKAIRRARGAHDAGVRFTFIIYENQRRWVGLGWTTSLFAYERPAWTDEHNNAVPPRDEFELPEVEDGSRMRWRWVDGSRWKVDGVPDEAVSRTDENGQEEWDYDGAGGKMGWVYYDNKWQNGRRGQDGWGRWTRRRKWYRDAELVEVEDEEPHSDEQTPTPGSSQPPPSLPPRPSSPTPSTPYHTENTMSMPNLGTDKSAAAAEEIAAEKAEADDEAADSASMLSTSSRSMRFKAPSLRRRVTDTTKKQRSRRASEALSEDDAASLGTQVGIEILGAAKERDQWGIGDEARMGLE